jgi:hypothetical protein
MNAMIRAGEIRDWAEAARLVGVTRARISQIARLMLLAPALQEEILFSTDPAHDSERRLRPTPNIPNWEEQVKRDSMSPHDG